MPNWCENNLSIYGNKNDMQKFLNAIRTEEDNYSILENLYPTPEELNIGDVSFNTDEQQIKNQEKYGYKSWYDWRIDKWGCKWPESSLSVGQEYTENSDDTAIIAFNFETPWSPPIEAFNTISANWPSLLFCLYYEEPGMGFCGNNVWIKGELQESQESQLVSRFFDEEYLYTTYMEEN